MFDFVYVIIHHFICYVAENNQSEPQENFSKLLDNLSGICSTFHIF